MTNDPRENKAKEGPGDPASFFRGLAAGAGPRPVHLWKPPFCGDMPLVIRADGRWDYRDSPIGRPELVALFASILRREGDEYFLVTPVEKLRITVEDAPFHAVEAQRAGEGSSQRLHLRLSTGEAVTVGPDHPLRLGAGRDPDAPYALVREGLWARLARPVYYEMMNELTAHAGRLGLWSGGAFFPLDGPP